MTLSMIKATVTRIFAQRSHLLQNMSGGQLSVDDSLELFVVTRAIDVMKRPTFNNTRRIRGAAVFVVAAAPSPSWEGASCVVDEAGNLDVAVRTGFQVRASDNELCEVDVGFYKLSKVISKAQDPAGVSHIALIAMAECKGWTAPLAMPTANEMVGKVYRLGGGPRCTSPMFALVCLQTSSASPLSTLAHVECRVFNVGTALNAGSGTGLSSLDKWVATALS